MSNAFNSQILEEKLSKLNNSQQSIETLSHWCIFHRKKAKQVVETWDKLFNSSQKEQRVSFLYLANDILQNSRRKGSEFVNEFWKVLPGALKSVSENSDGYGKTAVSRLVDIWEERKVFGSRGRSLKDEMLGKDPPPLLENKGRSSHSIKIVRKDAHSVRIKLAIGGMPEKIVTAFQSVHEEHPNEDSALSKCKAAVRCVGKMEKDVDSACACGDQQGSTLANELQEQETVLHQCIEQLESIEATRAALVTQLKEALQEQESKLELVRTQLQVAQAQTEQASAMRQRLVSGPNTATGPTSAAVPSESIPPPPIHPSGNPLPLPPQPLTSFADSKNTAEDQHKKAAAAMAAKLAASTYSAQMLSSVLSSLAAEEASSMNTSVTPASFTPIFSLEKRPKLEKPMSVSDANNAYFAHLQQPPLSTLPPVPSQTSTRSMQSMSQANQPQATFPPPPPPPPPPPVQQYVVGMVPYGYSSNGLPPPPPLPAHMFMSLPRPNPPQQQQQQQQQQQPVLAGYYQSPTTGFYGPTTPPVPRQ